MIAKQPHSKIHVVEDKAAKVADERLDPRAHRVVSKYGLSPFLLPAPRRNGMSRVVSPSLTSPNASWSVT